MPAKLGSPDDLGLALTTVRWLRGWEQEQLVAASGVTLSSIQALEQGRRKQPRLQTLIPVAAALGVDLATLGEMVALIRRIRDGVTSSTASPEQGAGAVAAESASTSPASFRREVTSLILSQLGRRDPHEAEADSGQADRQAPALWELLRGCSQAGRQALVRSLAEFHTAEFCVLLCDESVKAAGDSAEQALLIAELAVEVAEMAPGSTASQSRLQGYARAHIASALRVSGRDLPAAERAMNGALKLWEAGAAEDPGLLNEARVLQLEASLCRDLRRLPEALALLDEALALDRWGETPSLVLGKALALVELGEFEESIGLLRRATSDAEGQREPRQRFILFALLVLNLCHLARFAEAELLLPELRTLAAGLRNRLDQLRTDWLEAKVAAGLGRSEEAIAILDRVRGEFIDSDNSYDAALATLELAEIHAALGRTTEVQVLARESAPIFRAQGVHREAQRALDLFREAAEEDRAGAELVRSVVAYLYRARHDPHLRFDAAA
jgi:transcriptional regulator with XRE-family HTH domain